MDYNVINLALKIMESKKAKKNLACELLLR